jgi:hypothetical protein
VAYRSNNHLATYSTVIEERQAFIIDLKHREGKEHTGDSSTDATISWQLTVQSARAEHQSILKVFGSLTLATSFLRSSRVRLDTGIDPSLLKAGTSPSSSDGWLHSIVLHPVQGALYFFCTILLFCPFFLGSSWSIFLESPVRSKESFVLSVERRRQDLCEYLSSAPVRCSVALQPAAAHCLLRNSILTLVRFVVDLFACSLFSDVFA